MSVVTIEVTLPRTKEEFLLFYCQLSFKQSFKNFTVLKQDRLVMRLLLTQAPSVSIIYQHYSSATFMSNIHQLHLSALFISIIHHHHSSGSLINIIHQHHSSALASFISISIILQHKHHSSASSISIKHQHQA